MSDWIHATTETKRLLQKALDTFQDRGAIYRDNHQRLGALMDALFPQGVILKSADDHERFALISLLLVKLSRYAVEWNNGGHQDSIHDIIVYAAMLEARTNANRTEHGSCIDRRSTITAAK